jgi:hypothetical protein
MDSERPRIESDTPVSNRSYHAPLVDYFFSPLHRHLAVLILPLSVAFRLFFSGAQADGWPASVNVPSCR